MAVDNKSREEQNLERYGVWVKTGPDTRNRHDFGSLDLMDIEDTDQDGLLITEEEEKLLGELEESSLPDFGDFDDTFQESFEEDFDVKSSGMSDESTGMLHKIENEITLLRNEIRQLKDELTGLRLPAVSRQTAESADSGGFFDEEEEDETIALTGDELDNILDSADWTEESSEGDSALPEEMDTAPLAGEEFRPEPGSIGESDDLSEKGIEGEIDDLSFISEEDEFDDLSLDEDESEFVDSGYEDDIEETISFDDEETIDLSGDFTQVNLDVDEELNSIIDSDPAISILGSPDMPKESGDSETIEMYIPGSGENEDSDEFELDDESLVSIDDISGGDGFEEITDLEDFGLEGTAEMPLMDDVADVILEPSDFVEEDEQAVADEFDEGEEVEIDLTDNDEPLGSVNVGGMQDVEIEDISLDEFGLSDDEGSDVLSDTMGSDSDEGDYESVEDFDLEEKLAGSIDDEELTLTSGRQDQDNEVVLEDFVDFELEDLVPDDTVPLADLKESDAGKDLVIEEIDLVSDSGGIIPDEDEPAELDDLIEIGETDRYPETGDEITLDIGGTDLDGSDDDISEIESLDEVPFEEIDADDNSMYHRMSAEKNLDDIPEISVDEELGEIESVDEFSLDDDEILEDLEFELDDEPEGVQVTLPDDEFNELPGTEEVDLSSLEALATAPDLTEAEDADFAELPEIDLEAAVSQDYTSTEFREKSQTALELISLPGDLKDEIKEVLKYMDELLESLPEDKIQEFARSEHFEVYKRIFEDLGISEDGSA